MKARHAYSNYSLNWDGCTKCGMTSIKQMQCPNRQCRPPISKRRLKIPMPLIHEETDDEIIVRSADYSFYGRTLKKPVSTAAFKAALNAAAQGSAL